jgi:hypothetical protein
MVDALAFTVEFTIAASFCIPVGVPVVRGGAHVGRGAAKGWTNGGVVVLETDRLYGGDSQFCYVGKYNYSQPMTAEARVTHYHGSPTTAWGDAAQTFNVVLRGNVSPDRSRIEGTIERQGFPSTRFRMVKKEQLP